MAQLLITTPGTHTVTNATITAGVTVKGYAWGAGAGGGSSRSTGSSPTAGGGGGGGGFGEGSFVMGSSITVVVPGGGGGASGGNAATISPGGVLTIQGLGGNPGVVTAGGSGGGGSGFTTHTGGNGGSASGHATGGGGGGGASDTGNGGNGSPGTGGTGGTSGIGFPGGNGASNASLNGLAPGGGGAGASSTNGGVPGEGGAGQILLTWTPATSASFILSPNTGNTSSAIAVTATGTGTAWTSGTTFSSSSSEISSITTNSVNVVAQTASLTIHTSATTGVAVIKDSTDSAIANFTVNAPATFSLSPTTGTNGTGIAVTATGSHTSWISGTTFSISGPSGTTIVTNSVNVGAQTASLTVNSGVLTGVGIVSDSTDSATANFTITSIPPSLNIWLSNDGGRIWNCNSGNRIWLGDDGGRVWSCNSGNRIWVGDSGGRIWYVGSESVEPQALVKNQLSKQAGDSVPLTIDLGDFPEIWAGATITSCTITAVSGLTIGSPSVATNGYQVTANFSGGTSNTAYNVPWNVTLSTGVQFTRTAVLNVL